MKLKFDLTHVILTCIVIIACIFIYGLRNEVVSLKQEKTSLQTNIKISKTAISYYKDKHYRDVAQKQVMSIKTAALADQLIVLGFDKQKLQAQVGNLKNLNLYWEGKAKVSGRIDTVYIDSIIYIDNQPVITKKLDWSNKYLTLSQQYYPVNGKIHVDYTYTTGIELTVYDKSKGFLKGKELVADVVFTDPAMVLNKSDIVLNDKTKQKQFYETTLFKIGVGVVVGNLILK